MRTAYELGYVSGQRDGLRGGIDLARVWELAQVRAARALSRRTYTTEQARTDALGLYARVWGMQIFETAGDTARVDRLYNRFLRAVGLL